MTDFLVNRHYNLYSNKQLSYKVYICNDCTKKKKRIYSTGYII